MEALIEAKLEAPQWMNLNSGHRLITHICIEDNMHTSPSRYPSVSAYHAVMLSAKIECFRDKTYVTGREPSLF
jgi:hypothetical protein